MPAGRSGCLYQVIIRAHDPACPADNNVVKLFAAFITICFALFLQGYPGVGFPVDPKAALAFRTWREGPVFRYTGEVNINLGMAFRTRAGHISFTFPHGHIDWGGSMSDRTRHTLTGILPMASQFNENPTIDTDYVILTCLCSQIICSNAVLAKAIEIIISV